MGSEWQFLHGEFEITNRQSDIHVLGRNGEFELGVPDHLDRSHREFFVVPADRLLA